MSQQQIDEFYMRRCIQLAQNGRANARPNPMVGAVITAPATNSHPTSVNGQPSTVNCKLSTVNGQPSTVNGKLSTVNCQPSIIGEGYHVRCGEGHAEVNAFASVKPEDEHRLKDATIYVSLEPCAHYGKTPPCCDLIIRKGVKRVVVGCVDPFAKVHGRGIQKIREAGIEVTVGVLEQECQWLNRRFFTFHELHRPYIILKWAQTQDGYLDDHFQPLSISTPFTQMLSHQLRAEEDAIVVGRVTDEREHPQLTVREWSGDDPVRFVLGDRETERHRDIETNLGQRDKETEKDKEAFLRHRDRETKRVANLEALFAECEQRNLQSLIVEGGAKTHQSFLDAGLWDEIRVETGGMTVDGGTKAPPLPSNLREISRETYDGNTIVRYAREEER